MGTATKNISKAQPDLQGKLDKALKKVSRQLIEQEKKNNGYLIIADKEGNIKKVPAKDL